MKLVSQLGPGGVFIGATEADESPLEPGVFLIPGGAVDLEPPTNTPDGHFAYYTNGAWQFVAGPAPDVVETPDTPVTPEVPVAVSRFQARAALYQAGYLPAIDAYMALPETPVLQRMAWEDAQEFERTSPTVNGLAVMLGMTQTQLDDLFKLASKITA